MIYAIISQSQVVNIVEWDGTASWQPLEGCQAVPLIEGGIGWSYINGQFVSPPEREPDPELN